MGNNLVPAVRLRIRMLPRLKTRENSGFILIRGPIVTEALLGHSMNISLGMAGRNAEAQMNNI